MGKFVDLTGQRFGNLTVIERRGSDKYKNALWLCKCDCGNEVLIKSNNLRTGNSSSCGCIATNQRREKFLKHGLRHTRLYDIWRAMKQRCYYKKSHNYSNYGGRGIVVCNEWLNDAENFYNWAVYNGYKDGLTIDRIDVNGDYEPSNCRWVTLQEQNNNRRSNRLITYRGKTQNLTQWCKELNIKRSDFYYLLEKGYSDVDAVGSLLGFTKEQLDQFFMTNDYTKLIEEQ